MKDEVRKGVTAAVVLAAGSGKRMKAGRPKQFLTVLGRPVLFYALDAFQKSRVDEIVIVTGSDDIGYVRTDIVEKYGITKVKRIVAGGKERYHSVALGLKAVSDLQDISKRTDAGNDQDRNEGHSGKCDIVLIHDGARAFVTPGLINGLVDDTLRFGACVTATPVKDTIKIADGRNMIKETPDRRSLWAVQTPQAFEFDLIYDAYSRFIENEAGLLKPGISVTDDASVLEMMTGRKTKLIEGSYLNIKLTTPDDLLLAERILELNGQNSLAD